MPAEPAKSAGAAQTPREACERRRGSVEHAIPVLERFLVPAQATQRLSTSGVSPGSHADEIRNSFQPIDDARVPNQAIFWLVVVDQQISEQALAVAQKRHEFDLLGRCLHRLLGLIDGAASESLCLVLRPASLPKNPEEQVRGLVAVTLF